MIISDNYPSFSLSLANGSRWLITAGDTEAARIVEGLGRAMALAPVAGGADSPDGAYRRLQVAVDPGVRRPTSGSRKPGAFLCLLPAPADNEMLVIGMSRAALVIARAEQARSGFLVHGALARLPGQEPAGVLLAGVGSVGKSTASQRLPPPWRSLCDDATLVVRDREGNYHAHPWPTWSRFYDTADGKPGPGGRWEVEKSVPLRAVFFLGQAAEDRIAPLSATAAVPLLLETVEHVSRMMRREATPDQLQTLHRQWLAAAEKLMAVTPAFTLHLSLTGTFWREIEKSLAGHVQAPAPANRAAPGESRARARNLWPGDNLLPIVYTGPSMNPTLRHPDLLEVVPYGDDRPVRPGDVVYYLPPDRGPRIVHRVIKVSAAGISTRGDNNPAPDPYLLQPTDIIGRVTAAWRYDKRRRISGGLCGLLAHYSAGLRRRANRILAPRLHGLYRYLGTKTLFRRLLPEPLRPKVYEFRCAYLPPKLKLIVKGRVVGHYDHREDTWCIDRPWRLFINPAKLPVIHTRPLTENMTSADFNNLYSVVPGSLN